MFPKVDWINVSVSFLDGIDFIENIRGQLMVGEIIGDAGGIATFGDDWNILMTGPGEK